jgi:carboxymethylenebutenolidase
MTAVAQAGRIERLQASDGHVLDGYVSEPAGEPKGGLILVHELFGLTGHIRSVADRFAAAGYLTVAPALFDRVVSNLLFAYDQLEQGLETRAKISDTEALTDLTAAIDRAARAGCVGVIGYCWGGRLAWLAGARLKGVDAAVVYYGGGVAEYRREAPRVPVLAHFGERDAHIPVDQVRALGAAWPQAEVHIYPAGHGFNCEERSSYHPDCAALALDRTMKFFADRLLRRD